MWPKVLYQRKMLTQSTSFPIMIFLTNPANHHLVTQIVLISCWRKENLSNLVPRVPRQIITATVWQTVTHLGSYNTKIWTKQVSRNNILCDENCYPCTYKHKQSIHFPYQCLWLFPAGSRPKHKAWSRRSSVFDAVEKEREATIKQVGKTVKLPILCI